MPDVGFPILFPPKMPGMMEGGYLFNLATFTQSVAEVVNNPGNPYTFAADDPANWTVIGEAGGDPEVTERDPAQLHADTKTVGGALNFYSSASSFNPIVQQNSLVNGAVYEALGELTALVGGSLRINVGGTVVYTFSAVGAQAGIVRAGSTTIQLFPNTSVKDFTLKYQTAKRITFNAVQTAALGADIRAAFTLPASPVVGQRIDLWYRMPAGAPYVDGWVCYLQYSGTQWQLLVNRYTTGTPTAVVTAIDVGTPNALRVVVSGDEHRFYTGTAGINGAFTQRSTAQTSTVHNDALQTVLVYNSAITPLQFQAT